MGSSSRQPTLLGPNLRLAQGVQVALTSKVENILAAVPKNDLVVELVDIHSHALIIGRMLWEELEKNSATVVAKMKADLNESSNSLKTTLDAMGALDEKLH